MVKRDVLKGTQKRVSAAMEKGGQIQFLTDILIDIFDLMPSLVTIYPTDKNYCRTNVNLTETRHTHKISHPIR